MTHQDGPTRAAAPSRFVRLAGWARRNRKRALGLWLAILVATVAASAAVGGGDFDSSAALPGTESQEVIDTLRAQAPAQAGDAIQIVLRDPAGVESPAARERVEPMLDRVAELASVAGVASPYETAGAISRDGEIAFATVALDATADEVPRGDVLEIVDAARAAAGGGLQVELGGDAVRYADPQGGGGAESAGTIAALAILVLLFGSLLAASLPLITALFAVGATMSLIVVASHLLPVADYTPPLMSLVGLGVGIDYALLVFARYRAELLRGRDRDAALEKALDTAGRSIAFAGATVVVALLGMLALGIGPLQGIALGVSLTVLVTLIASLTLLPALISLTGARVERAIRKRAARRDHRAVVRAQRRDRAVGREGDGWRRWTARIQRRPGVALTISLGLLAMLAIPATGMRLGFADAGNDATDTTVRQAYDLLARGFGTGFNGPLVIVADGADGPAVKRLSETLRDTPGIAAVGAPQPGGEGSDVTTLIAYPDGKPQDEATAELVADLRREILPPLARETGARYLVGGQTAGNDDFAAVVRDRLPLFLAIVVGLSMVLLAVVFRSLLIPLKAAFLNLLSIGAALGVVTIVFQEGAFGVASSPIDATIPILIFAIVFGLSMDYEVFLVSRMREEWLRRGDPHAAVREGIAATGAVVTAAAAIMIVVFAAFMLSPDRMMKQFGLGLAAAIAIDAFVIRCLLLPAIMRLLGRAAWWMPRGLRKRLPRVELERA